MMRQLITYCCIFLILGCSNNNSKTELENDKTLMESRISDTLVIRDSVIIKERLFDNLSYENNFKLTFIEYFSNNIVQSHYWTVIIYDKKMNKVDSIYQPVYMYNSNLIDFDKARSYKTGINQNSEVSNNYYGDFIVADFNFDLKSDFAIINDISGNVGARYSYYIQKGNYKFLIDKFLTDSMSYFPTKINVENRTLVTNAHASAYGVEETTYTLDKTNKWSETSHTTNMTNKK